MAIYYPTKEAHYLTVDGDVIDRIAFDYYGTEKRTTEQLLMRNPWVAEHFPVLTAGLILVLPVLDKNFIQKISTTSSPPLNEKGQSLRRLWNYRTPKLWKGGESDPVIASTAADADALDAYRRSKQQAGSGTGSGTGSNSDCCVELRNPPEFSDFEWLAIYYRDATGKWKLGRIHKSNVNMNTDGYGYATASVASVTDPLADGLV